MNFLGLDNSSLSKLRLRDGVHIYTVYKAQRQPAFLHTVELLDFYHGLFLFS